MKTITSFYLKWGGGWVRKLQKLARPWPDAHVGKELSKMPREAVCLAVSSRVRRNFGEKFPSRGRKKISNIFDSAFFSRVLLEKTYKCKCVTSGITFKFSNTNICMSLFYLDNSR